MATPDPDPQDRRVALSALMDGQTDGCDDACRWWRNDAGARADWHAWHVIGDVMRSDEHRADAAHDARFLARVREQLAREPVVLAPEPVAVAAARRRRMPGWMAPTAVAAGFVAVAGALIVTRSPAPEEATRVAAGSPPAAAPVVAAVAASSVDASGVETASMIRSVELDRYLAAHRQYGNGALQVAPGGGLRQAAALAPGR